jgi:ABC-type phosphate/phosphonate transport system substrate-binding protein
MPYLVRSSLAVAIAAALPYGIPRSSADEQMAASRPTVRIGVAESLCRDTDPKVLMALVPPFRALAKSCTGLDCDLLYGGDAFQLADRLAKGQLDLGIFQGIELAWVRQRHPELQPLVTVLNGKPYLRAALVVPASSRATCLGDLKDRSVAIPHYSLEDCYLFLGKLCREQGLSLQPFPSRVTQPADAEEALDAVAEGAVGAAIVEELCLDCYQRRKPGRFERLKVLQRSEQFPASVVAYRAGRLSEATLRLFRKGICRAHQDPCSRDLLTWWRITAFEPVPATYPQALDEIVKTYPTPTSASQAQTLRALLDQADQFLGQKWSALLDSP